MVGIHHIYGKKSLLKSITSTHLLFIPPFRSYFKYNHRKPRAFHSNSDGPVVHFVYLKKKKKKTEKHTCFYRKRTFSF